MPWCDIHIPEGVSQTCTDPNTGFSSLDPGRPQPSEGSKLSETVGVCRSVTCPGHWRHEGDQGEDKSPLLPQITMYLGGKSPIVLPVKFGPSDFPWKWNVTKREKSSKYWDLEVITGKGFYGFLCSICLFQRLLTNATVSISKSRNYRSCLPKFCSGRLVFFFTRFIPTLRAEVTIFTQAGGQKISLF